MMLTLITTVGTSSYLIASKPVATWPTPPLAKGDLNERLEQTPLPSTIIDVSGVVDLISSSWLQRTVDEMLARDDVFCVDFLSSIFFLYSTEGTPPALGYDAKVLLKSWGSFAACQRNPGTQIPPPSGPYFLLNWKVHQIFKLYPDPYGAFMYGVVQSEEDPTRSAHFCYL
jgi:hypothetical protein